MINRSLADIEYMLGIHNALAGSDRDDKLVDDELVIEAYKELERIIKNPVRDLVSHRLILITAASKLAAEVERIDRVFEEIKKEKKDGLHGST